MSKRMGAGVLVIGAATALPWACGSSNDTGPPADHPTTSVSSSSASSSASTGGAGGQGGAETICQQGCDKLEVICGFGPVCEATDILDCQQYGSDCTGQCLLDASCEAIGSITTSMPDQPLLDCLQGCVGFKGCGSCVKGVCAAGLQACLADAVCLSFVGCFKGCTDGACLVSCAAMYPSPAVDALASCARQYCAISCELTQGAGGSGGTGGGTGGGTTASTGGAGGA